MNELQKDIYIRELEKTIATLLLIIYNLEKEVVELKEKLGEPIE